MIWKSTYWLNKSFLFIPGTRESRFFCLFKKSNFKSDLEDLRLLVKKHLADWHLADWHLADSMLGFLSYIPTRCLVISWLIGLFILCQLTKCHLAKFFLTKLAKLFSTQKLDQMSFGQIVYNQNVYQMYFHQISFLTKKLTKCLLAKLSLPKKLSK